MIDSDFTIGFKQGQEHGKQIILEKVEDIRAEIEFERDRKIGGEFFEAVQYKSFNKCLDIIDKHIKGVNNAQEL